MVRKFPRFTKLGRPLCYVIPALMLLSLLFSASVPPAGTTTLVGEETADDLTVRWYLVRDGVTHKIYEIEVQNLGATSRTVWLDTFFSDASFPIDQLHNVLFFEWKALDDNYTFWYDNEDAPIYENTIFMGYERYSVVLPIQRCQWKACKTQWFVRTATTIKEAMGNMFIPKFGSKAKYDNFGRLETENGIKRFRIEFDVPVQSRAGGWGSTGKVALFLDDTEFHPWWDGSWNYRVPLTLNIGENVPPENYQYVIFLENDNFNGHAMDNFQDLRFLEDETTGELDFWFGPNYFSGENLTVVVERAENSLNDNTIFCYYGNPSAGPAENMVETLWLRDDFDDGDYANDPTWTVSSGEWDASGNSLLAVVGGYIETGSGIDDFVMDVDITSGSTNSGDYVTFRFTDTNNTYHFGSITGDWYFRKVVGGGWDDTSLGGTFSADTTYHLTIQAYGDSMKLFVDGAQQGSTMTDSALTSGKIGASDHVSATSRTWDNIRVRRFVMPEPTVTAGAEETPSAEGNVWVEEIGRDNGLVDRAANLGWSSPVLATQINVTVSDNEVGRDGLTMENVFLWVYDANSNTVVDNVNPTSYENVDENTKKFYFDSYNPADAMADANLGDFSAFCEAYDNGGNYDNLNNSNVFTVDDLDDSVVLSQENLAGHRHRIYGTAVRETGGSVTLTDGRRIDSNDGTTNASISGANFENTWTASAAGDVYFELTTAELDGRTDNLEYAFPNFAPGIVSITSSEDLIDRDQDYAGSGATLSTRVTVVFEDNDGYGDFDNARIAWRDALDAVVENQNVWGTVTQENENLIIVYLENGFADSLADSQLGAWDVHAYATDIYGGEATNSWGGDGASLFTVDDLQSTINFNPTNPYVGWDLTVSGTHSRVVGSVSIDASWLIDNLHGQISMGAADTYSETYTISLADLGENAGVTIRVRDSPLDGVTVSSYETHENVQFEVWVRFEDNYEVVGWIPSENRPVELLFEWAGGTHPYTLTSNPENVIVPTSGVNTKIVKITDNDAYWRYIIPTYSGGQLTFVVVDDPIEVEQYRFYLQDYTGLYIPPNGQLLIKLWIGTNLADINNDFWGADWRTTAWLVTGTQYQIWVRAPSAALRLVGPIDAVVPDEEKTIVVQSVISELDPIYDYVYWAAWRVDNNTIRVEYQDNLDNTVTAHVGIYDMDGNLMVEYQPDNEWFITTWVGAENEESYEVVLTVLHDVYGSFTMSMPIDLMEGPAGVEGTGNPFDLPTGLTLASLGSLILVLIVGLSFDALRVQMGILAMALTVVFCWFMGFLPLPGPWGGAFTATLILVMAVLFALTWRRGK